MQTLKMHLSSTIQSVTVVITVLATMGLTFTKTRWICMTHTFQSIHEITRLCHQQAHRAYHLTVTIQKKKPTLWWTHAPLTYSNKWSTHIYFLQAKICNGNCICVNWISCWKKKFKWFITSAETMFQGGNEWFFFHRRLICQLFYQLIN